MGSDLVLYQLALVVLVWLFLMLHVVWPSSSGAGGHQSATPTSLPHKRSRDPKPFGGLTQKPACEACEQRVASPPLVPCIPPPRIILTRGRRRQVDTSGHFCPQTHCTYHGWVGLGNLRANGHPSGRRWRQLYCLGCKGYFQETHGTLLQGKHVELDMLVWAVGALAEGLGIRAVARVFEVDANTVLAWLVKVAEHAAPFHAISCTTYTSPRCNWTNSLPCSTRCRPAR